MGSAPPLAGLATEQLAADTITSLLKDANTTVLSRWNITSQICGCWYCFSFSTSEDMLLSAKYSLAWGGWRQSWLNPPRTFNLLLQTSMSPGRFTSSHFLVIGHVSWLIGWYALSTSPEHFNLNSLESWVSVLLGRILWTQWVLDGRLFFLLGWSSSLLSRQTNKSFCHCQLLSTIARHCQFPSHHCQPLSTNVNHRQPTTGVNC